MLPFGSFIGGRPTIPKVPGAELGIDSDGFFDLEHQPKRVAVVGTGYIGIELAGIFHALGKEIANCAVSMCNSWNYERKKSI